MKQELSWGTAAALAIVAAVGISSQSGNKAIPVPSEARPATVTSGTPKPRTRKNSVKVQSQCEESIPALEHFFMGAKIVGPGTCYGEGPKPAAAPLNSAFQPNFIIATLPDPLHTHFSLLFDRLIEAIQQGAQDEEYEYDSSWLPWETEESSFALLKDQDEANDRKAQREHQPGILLFRHSGESAYRKGLIVFIVGEEPTGGIHREQFENAVAWIKALQQPKEQRTSVVILGPTFSGSFPSLSELLARTSVATLNEGNRLSIYSGSASSKSAAESFSNVPRREFRSFLQDDETLLNRFCQYLGGSRASELSQLAILSEDETAYGNSAYSHIAYGKSSENVSNACGGALKIYYPRDISTLRAAYQNQSMFSSGSAQPKNLENAPRKSLPTDLADPAGQQHDTVRSYAGNQRPLSQEAQLLGIVDALRAHHSEYVVLRSSNSLDPLFLANFLHRNDPEARIVILNSDLLFQRGQDAMALTGVMTLSTYPHFSWGRRWTIVPPYISLTERVFPETTAEGTYIASRLLLQNLAKASNQTSRLSCELVGQSIFTPALRCTDHNEAYAPLPDYTPPYWTESTPCNLDTSESACAPATWLSVITKNGTLPLAALDEHTLSASGARVASAPAGRAPSQPLPDPGRWPALPLSFKILLVSVCGLALFHAYCCRFASFTAKPAFRAHFATPGLRHTGLVLIGSYLIAVMALLSGWGAGMFSAVPGPQTGVWSVSTVVLFICLVTPYAMFENIVMTRKLNGYRGNPVAGSAWRIAFCVVTFCLLIWGFFVLLVHPLENVLLLASRAFVYWRSVNLTSGVSPIVPFLSLTAGLYLWFWYALHGLALFGPDRPRLPRFDNLEVELPGQDGKQKLKLSMFSYEKAGNPVETLAAPLAWSTVTLMLVLFVSFVAIVIVLAGAAPIRSLGGRLYGQIFCLMLIFCFCLLLAEAWQTWRVWSGVRQLLVFLDRLALRRTLSSLHGFSWGSVWKMSGNVLDVRYKLLSRQMECLTHLNRSLGEFKEPDDSLLLAAFQGVPACIQSVHESQKAGMEFAKWYSERFDKPKASDLSKFADFQWQVADTTGVVLTELLIPASRMEEKSLIQEDPEDKRPEKRRQEPHPSNHEAIRNAEELVCLTYLGFTQNLLGRIRTIVLGGVYLFIASSIAVSSYPFDPRPLLSGVLLFVFFAFGWVVVSTYADMHRDATLSHVTDTNPGELGSEFWFKMVGYGAAPLLTLITQIFPEWSGFLFSWLQPGLSSLK